MNPNLLIYHFHPPLSFCNHVCFLTVCVFHFYKIAHWYPFLLLKYVTLIVLVLDNPCKWHFFMAKSYSILYIYEIFTHSSVHVHFGYFHVSAVVHAAAVHACVQCCSVATSILQNPDSPHETLSPLSPPLALGAHHPAFCVYGANCSRCLVWVDSNIICSSMFALCHWA